MKNTKKNEKTLQQPTLRDRVFSLPTLIALLIGGLVLGFVLWRVFDFNWEDLLDNILAINWWQYVLAIVLYYLSFWFRGLRWRLIAIAANIDRKNGENIPGIRDMGLIILMGWFANSVAFFRLGDALRGWTLARASRSPFSSSLGTVVAERVQDMVAVLALVLVAAIWVTVSGGGGVPVGVVIAAIVLVVVLISGLVTMRLYGLYFARWLPERFSLAYEKFQHGTLDSFQSTQLPRQFLLSVIGWLLEIGRLYFVVAALGMDLDFGVIMFVALASAMLSTIPTPGGFGFVEGGLTGLLIVFGMDNTSALSLTIVDRSISWLSVVFIGGLVFFIWHITRGRRNYQNGN